LTTLHASVTNTLLIEDAVFTQRFQPCSTRLRKSPVLAAPAIVSLALGIGTNVTVFSVVREMILDDLSASHPDRLARVESLDVSYTVYRELQGASVFEDLAFHRGLRDRIWRADTRSEMVWTFTTSSNFFDVLGIRASTGRLYSQAGEGRDSQW
jgi:putative ABC transport system permease protein